MSTNTTTSPLFVSETDHANKQDDGNDDSGGEEVEDEGGDGDGDGDGDGEEGDEPVSYEGERNEAGEMHGTGKVTFADGSCYSGEFKQNLKHGKGVLFLQDGSVYDGTFLEDEYSGFGTFKHSSGDEFAGQFLEDEMVSGVYRYANGDVYDGEFENQVRSGKGTIRYETAAERDFRSLCPYLMLIFDQWPDSRTATRTAASSAKTFIMDKESITSKMVVSTEVATTRESTRVRVRSSMKTEAYILGSTWITNVMGRELLSTRTEQASRVNLNLV
jgi:hypothetical protein